MLVLPATVVVDVRLIKAGGWQEAVGLPGLGRELLEGFEVLGSPEFESWLLAQRRNIAGSTEDVLREAALALLGRGETDKALGLAVSLVGMNPYVENHQALLIRAYLMSGDVVAAERQLQACTELFVRELGSPPGPTVRTAFLARTDVTPRGTDVAAVEAIIEAGTATMAAGAPEAGVMSLRSGVALADSLAGAHLRASSRLALANALVHAVRGEDEEGAVVLHEVARLALEADDDELDARARVELGYIDMLAARYDRSEKWLALDMLHTSDPAILAKAHSYLGCVQSDRAHYESARVTLNAAVEYSRMAGDRRQEAYATSLSGRLELLLGNLDSATRMLNESIELGQSDAWLAFLPWPQALLGEVQLERGDLHSASRILEQAFARACQIGDPCWEGVSGRGLALLAEARGDTKDAFVILQDAADRCSRLSDTYIWAEAYILDTQCSLGLVHGHQETAEWITKLYALVTRTGMRELQVRAMIHRTTIGTSDEHDAAVNLADHIANPRLLAMTARP
ncbi:MAG: bacterial transcriptional activator domain-containing protein [Acidimicrobiia bacterium]